MERCLHWAPDPSTPQVPPASVAEIKWFGKKKENKSENGQSLKLLINTCTVASTAMSTINAKFVACTAELHTHAPKGQINAKAQDNAIRQSRLTRTSIFLLAIRSSGVPGKVDVRISQPSESESDCLNVNTQVIGNHSVVQVLSDEGQSEYVDQKPSHFDCKVHVVLLVVIGNSWLWVSIGTRMNSKLYRALQVIDCFRSGHRYPERYRCTTGAYVRWHLYLQLKGIIWKTSFERCPFRTGISHHVTWVFRLKKGKDLSPKSDPAITRVDEGNKNDSAITRKVRTLLAQQCGMMRYS